MPSPPRARIAGLRASSFGDLIFVDHAEIKYGTSLYLVLLIIDGATNLLWATALTTLEVPETLGAFRLWIEENNCMPKGIVGDQAFFQDMFMDFYKFHGIAPYPCGPRTPWPNRAETAVRLFKRAWVYMAKSLEDEGYVDKVTVRQVVKKVVWARNCQLTVSGYSPLEIATGRRPPDLFDVETSTPEQLSSEPPEEDRTMLQLQRIALKAHQEARQAVDLRKDLAPRVMPSDGPYSPGDKVFVWMKNESKKKSEGIWVRGKVVSQEGAMVLVHIHRSVLRVNQSKVRRDHDPWHDVAVPLNPEQAVPEGEGAAGSREGAPEHSHLCSGYQCKCCFEHEVCFHTFTSQKSDFVEISATASGLTACIARSGLSPGQPILASTWNKRKIMHSIAQAWKTIEELLTHLEPGAKQTFANPDQYMQPQSHVPASQPIVPIQKHPHFPIPQVMRPPSPRNVPLTRSTGAHPDDRRPKAKLRFPDVTGIQPPPVRVVSKPKAEAEPVVIQPPAPVALLGQGLKEKGPPIDPDIDPAGPPAIPGLPVTEGEFPIVPQSPAPHDAVPIPESGSESDSDRTVYYRDDPATLLALVESSDDVLLQLPDDFYVPDFVPLDGDGFASWLTRQDKIKAGSVTPEMARRYAKEIRMAKLDEFKSYLDNGALRLADKRKLSRDVNFLTGRWVLTVKVDKNGYFSKFKARWVCRGFQDKHAWEQQTDSPTATRYGFRLVAQCAANNCWDLFHLDLKTAFLQGEHYNLESRSVVIQLPHDIGLPPWMVGVCLRPVYGLNDAPRRWWNRLDKFLRSIGLEPTRADRCTYVAYQGTEKRHNASIAQEGCGTLIPVPSSGDPGASSYLNEVALSALNCYAYDEGSQSPSDTAEERSYMSCPDIADASNLLLRRR